MSEAYDKFKKSLSLAAERGNISKETKRRFSHFSGEGGELAYAVCCELMEFFLSEGRGSRDYPAAAERVIGYLSDVADGAPVLKEDVATVCAYIKLTVAANGSGEPAAAFEKLKAHSAEYNERLQSIRYGMPLFGGEK